MRISIISLSIPYVKESAYKERMSKYIDETIEAAEGFNEQDGKFRYIRNRLTWKRLFSVIVTDMNSIRINLYKRERIKDQSRYLRGGSRFNRTVTGYIYTVPYSDY